MKIVIPIQPFLFSLSKNHKNMCRSHSQAMVTNSSQEKDAGWERDSIVPFHLIVILLLFLLVVDLEVAELVGVLGRGNHAQPITQIVLFQVLQIAFEITVLSR